MGYRIEEMFLCLDCKDLQDDQEHQVYVHMCSKYCSTGKCMFLEPGEVSDYSNIRVSTSLHITSLEDKGFIVSTEAPYPHMLFIKPIGYSSEVNEGRLAHRICAYRELHDEDD